MRALLPILTCGCDNTYELIQHVTVYGVGCHAFTRFLRKGMC
jgi:hypothetical protein